MSEAGDFDSERFERVYAELLTHIQEVVERHLYVPVVLGPAHCPVYAWDGEKWVVGVDPAGGDMSEHDHDWRIDPFMVLPTDPPKRRIVCAECGEKQSMAESDPSKPTAIDPLDPTTWPKLY